MEEDTRVLRPESQRLVGMMGRFLDLPCLEQGPPQDVGGADAWRAGVRVARQPHRSLWIAVIGEEGGQLESV